MHKIFFSWWFYFMTVHFLLLLFLLSVNLRYLFAEIKKIKLRIWIILLIIFLCGFYLRNSEYWRGPFSDGYMHEDSAQMWILHGDYNQTCMLGSQSDCRLTSRVMFLPGYPYLIALTHMAFGINTLNASIISAVLSSITIIMIFLIGYLIFRKEQVGLFAALIFSLIPINIIQSQTGLSRPTGLFFVGLTILFYLLAIKNNRLTTWLLVAICLSYSIYVRQESLILLPWLILLIIIFKYHEIKQFFKKLFISRSKIKIWLRFISSILIFFIFILLQLPALNWLLFHNPFNMHSVKGSIWGLHFKGVLIQSWALFEQLFNQSSLWFHDIFHYNTFASIIFIFSFLIILFSFNKKGYFILGVFLVYFFIYSLMFDGLLFGHNQLTHNYVRRSLMLNLPYAIVTGYGIYLLNPFGKRKKMFLSFIYLLFIICFIVSLFSFGITPIKYIKNFNSNTLSRYYSFYLPKSFFRDARTDKSGDPSLVYAYNNYWLAASRIPDNCIVITYNNLIITDNYLSDKNLKAAKIDRIQSDTVCLFEEEFRKHDCIVYFEDRYCLRPRNIPWQDYNYPCWYIKNKLDTELLFIEGNINVYKAKLHEAI